MTEWRTISGFPGYEISNDGAVRSLDRHDGRGWRIRGRMLAGSQLPNGYRCVQLYRSGERHYRYVHRLVLEAFVGPCPPGLETRHLNGQRADNRLENLAWGTPVDNASDRRRHGTDVRPKALECKHGHDLTDPSNLTVAGKCRTCQKARSRESMARYRHAHPTGRTPNQLKTHCKHGHEFTPENTRIRHSKRGRSRACLTCKREQNAEYKQRKRAARKETSA